MWVPVTVLGALLGHQAIEEIRELLLKVLPLLYLTWTINRIKFRKHPEVVVPCPPNRLDSSHIRWVCPVSGMP